jgi:hypothetical protein
MNSATHSRRLREKIRIARGRLDAVARALWSHPLLSEIYPEFLFRNHAVIRASVPLMQAAAAVCEPYAASDPLAGGIFSYLTHHIPEEMHHDDWILEDLEVLNISRREVLPRIPPPAAAALVGTQYYWIRHCHPVALLGFIAVLEGTPPDVDYFERLADTSGIPRQAFSNLLRHGRLDPRHRDDLDDALDKLPLTEYHHSLLGVSSFQTIHLLAQVVEDMLESASKPRSRAVEALP